MIKATGIVRRIDELGRIVLPIELRRALDIEIHDPIEVFTDSSSIILKKYEPGCIFCRSMEGVTNFKGKIICTECRKKLINYE